MAILLFEVMIFFLTIVSTICFLITSRFISFKTLRERAGFGGRMRYEIDFLDFVKDDLHWVLISQTLIFLMLYANYYLKNVN